jgi:(p)ppGpp synthase/HD superfamily hydrolase
VDIAFKAINFAARAHERQKRKTDPDLPYIVHPAGVAVILTKVGANDETIAAGALHDVIEDCGVSKQKLEKEFGADVARMVNDITEQNPDDSWHERKKEAIEHIKEMKHDSLLVKAADINHNLSSLMAAIDREGLTVLNRFNAPLPDQVEMNKKRYEALEKAWKENPLLPQLKELVDKLTAIEKGL